MHRVNPTEGADAHRHSSKLWCLDDEILSIVPREGAWQGHFCCLTCYHLFDVSDNPMDCKEIPVYPKGDHSWVFIGRTDVEAETPILWSPDAKSGLI